MIKITNSNTTQNTDSNGIVNFNTNLNKLGKYTITASYAGDSTHELSSSTSQTFTVLNPSTNATAVTIQLTTSANPVYNGDTFNLTATCTVGGSTIRSGVTVNFVQITSNQTLNSLGDAETNANGVATLSNIPVTASSVGQWTIYAYISAISGEFYYSTSNEIVITANPVNTSLTLTANSTTINSGNSARLTATLHDDTNNTYINGKTITLYNGSTYVSSGTTDNNGQVTFSVSLTKDTTYYAYFTSADGYLGDSASIRITVDTTATAKNTTLTCSLTNGTNYSIHSASSNYSNTVAVTGVLKDSSNNPVSNASVIVYIKSKENSNTMLTLTGTTNSNGVYNVSRSVTSSYGKTFDSGTNVGLWEVWAVYAGSQGTYNASSTSASKITITCYDDWYTTFINLPTDGSTITPGTNFNPKLVDYNGNGIGGRSASITFKVKSTSNSETFSGTTLYTGEIVNAQTGTSYGVTVNYGFDFTTITTASFSGVTSTYSSCSVEREYTYDA